MVPLMMGRMNRGRSLRKKNALRAKGIEGLEFVASFEVCSAGASSVCKGSCLRYSPEFRPELCEVHGDDGEEDRGKDGDEDASGEEVEVAGGVGVAILAISVEETTGEEGGSRAYDQDDQAQAQGKVAG